MQKEQHMESAKTEAADNHTAGGHPLPPDWLARIALIWGGYAVSAFAGNATMPLLVPERHLMRINSMDALLGSISMIAAPALGILLFTTFGLQASIALGGVFILALALAIALPKSVRALK